MPFDNTTNATSYITNTLTSDNIKYVSRSDIFSYSGDCSSPAGLHDDDYGTYGDIDRITDYAYHYCYSYYTFNKAPESLKVTFLAMLDKVFVTSSIIDFVLSFPQK